MHLILKRSLAGPHCIVLHEEGVIGNLLSVSGRNDLALHISVQITKALNVYSLSS